MSTVIIPTVVSIPKLHDRAMLSYISVSAPAFRKLDKKSTSEVTNAANATSDAVRVNKHLLASADTLLKDIAKKGGEARRYLDANSLPWDDAGNRLLSNEKAIEVVAKIGVMEREYRGMVDQFVNDYPVLRAQALANLGDLADPGEYPPPSEIRSKFAMRLSLSPVPEGFGDVRTGLSPVQASALQAQYEARVRMQFHTAIKDAWDRLRDNVSKIADRMQAEEVTDKDGTKVIRNKIFRDSLFENAQETCILLKSLNVFDDPQLEQVRFEVEQFLCQDPKQVRENDTLARAIKDKADEVLERMKAILGE